MSDLTSRLTDFVPKELDRSWDSVVRLAEYAT